MIGGSEDGFLYFWDLVDASVTSSFKAHASVVKFFIKMQVLDFEHTLQVFNALEVIVSLICVGV